jgi:hypothetical protein
MTGGPGRNGPTTNESRSSSKLFPPRSYPFPPPRLFPYESLKVNYRKISLSKQVFTFR